MIEGKTINLRLMTQEDLDLYVQLTNSTKYSEDYYPLVVWTKTETQKMFNEHGFFADKGGRLLITTKEDEMIGFISYFKSSPYMNGYELGYKIFEPKHHGNGYTTEAVKLFSAFMFEHKSISRLQICMIDEHIGSAKVAEKAGYTFEGIVRDVALHCGHLISNRMYSLIRSEVKTLEQVKAEL